MRVTCVLVCLGSGEEGDEEASSGDSFSLTWIPPPDASRSIREKTIDRKKSANSAVIAAVGEYVRLGIDSNVGHAGAKKSVQHSSRGNTNLPNSDSSVDRGELDGTSSVRIRVASFLPALAEGSQPQFKFHNGWDQQTNDATMGPFAQSNAKDSVVADGSGLESEPERKRRLTGNAVRECVSSLAREAISLSDVHVQSSLVVIAVGLTWAVDFMDTISQFAQESWSEAIGTRPEPKLQTVLVEVSSAVRANAAANSEIEHFVVPARKCRIALTAFALEHFGLKLARIVGVPLQCGTVSQYRAVDLVVPLAGCLARTDQEDEHVESSIKASINTGRLVPSLVFCWKSVDRQTFPMQRQCSCSHPTTPLSLASDVIGMFGFLTSYSRPIQLVQVPRSVLQGDDARGFHLLATELRISAGTSSDTVIDRLTSAEAMRSTTAGFPVTHTLLSHGPFVRVHCISLEADEHVPRPMPLCGPELWSQVRTQEFGQDILEYCKLSIARDEMGSVDLARTTHLRKLTHFFAMLDAETLLFSQSLCPDAKRLLYPLLTSVRHETDLEGSSLETCMSVVTRLRHYTTDNDATLFPQIAFRDGARAHAYRRLWKELQQFLNAFAPYSSGHSTLAQFASQSSPGLSSIGPERKLEAKPLEQPAEKPADLRGNMPLKRAAPREMLADIPIEEMPVIESRSGEVHRAELFESFLDSSKTSTDNAWTAMNRAEKVNEEQRWKERDASQAPARRFRHATPSQALGWTETPTQKRQRVGQDAAMPINNRESLYFQYWGAALASRLAPNFSGQTESGHNVPSPRSSVTAEAAAANKVEKTS